MLAQAPQQDATDAAAMQAAFDRAFKGRPAVSGRTLDRSDGTRMYDDALFVRRLLDGWFVQISVADVPAFVRPGSAIDGMARKLCCDRYIGEQKVAAMLPHLLVRNYLSLDPGKARLAVTFSIELDWELEIRKVDVARTLFTSDCQYSTSSFLRAVYKGDSEALAIFNLGAELIAKRQITLDRMARGALLHTSSRPPDVAAFHGSDADYVDRIISCYMRIAALAGGRVMQERNIPAYYKEIPVRLVGDREIAPVFRSAIQGLREQVRVTTERNVRMTSPLHNYLDLMHLQNLTGSLEGGVPPYQRGELGSFYSRLRGLEKSAENKKFLVSLATMKGFFKKDSRPWDELFPSVRSHDLAEIVKNFHANKITSRSLYHALEWEFKYPIDNISLVREIILETTSQEPYWHGIRQLALDHLRRFPATATRLLHNMDGRKGWMVCCIQEPGEGGRDHYTPYANINGCWHKAKQGSAHGNRHDIFDRAAVQFWNDYLKGGLIKVQDLSGRASLCDEIWHRHDVTQENNIIRHFNKAAARPGDARRALHRYCRDLGLTVSVSDACSLFYDGTLMHFVNMKTEGDAEITAMGTGFCKQQAEDAAAQQIMRKLMDVAEAQAAVSAPTNETGLPGVSQGKPSPRLS